VGLIVPFHDFPLYHDDERRKDDDSDERIFVPILDRLDLFVDGQGLWFVSQRFFGLAGLYLLIS
jgi:hypothetical protein